MTKRNKVFWIITSILVLLIAILLIAAALIVDDWSRDLSTNTAETLAEAADPQMRPLASEATFDQIEQAVREICNASSTWEFATTEPEQQTIKLVHVSGMLGFRDDVTLRVEKASDEQVIHIRSQSRIGKGDLGQNPRNIRKLRGLLTDMLEDGDKN